MYKGAVWQTPSIVVYTGAAWQTQVVLHMLTKMTLMVDDGTFSQLEHVVSSAQVSEEHSHRPAVRDRVMRADDQHVVLCRGSLVRVADGDEGGVDHGPGGHVEWAGNGLLQRILQVLFIC